MIDVTPLARGCWVIMFYGVSWFTDPSLPYYDCLDFNPHIYRVARQKSNTFASNKTFFVIARFSKI
jgi:hypothetical protein